MISEAVIGIEYGASS